MTRRSWSCASSRVLGLGAASVVAGAAAGCYSTSRFKGDGRIEAGERADSFKYRVQLRLIDLGSPGTQVMSVSGLPPGMFKMIFVGECGAVKSLAADPARTVRVSFVEAGHETVFAGGALHSDEWILSESEHKGTCHLSTRQWRGPDEAVTSKTYEIVVTVETSTPGPRTWIRPTLIWMKPVMWP